MTPDETRVFGEALGTIARSQAALSDEQQQWLREVPVQRGIEAFDDALDLEAFDFVVGPNAEVVDAEVHREGGAEWARAYWHLVLLHFVVQTIQAPRLVLCPSVREPVLADLERIVGGVASGVFVEDPLGNEAFLVDAALARGSLLPMESFFGIPMWISDTPGMAEGMWLGMHFRDVEQRGFTIETVNAGSDLILELFEANPDLRGWFGITWLLDPNLAEVSPHLTWYRELLLRAGANITPTGTDEETVALATGTSKTRRDLFEGGRYQPHDFRVVLPREQVLQWFESTGLPHPLQRARGSR